MRLALVRLTRLRPRMPALTDPGNHQALSGEDAPRVDAVCFAETVNGDSETLGDGVRCVAPHDGVAIAAQVTLCVRARSPIVNAPVTSTRTLMVTGPTSATIPPAATIHDAQPHARI